MKWFVDYVLETTTWGKGNSVLDIACNDGTQLDYFKDEGFKTYGVDPAENLHKLSSKNHEVLLLLVQGAILLLLNTWQVTCIVILVNFALLLMQSI